MEAPWYQVRNAEGVPSPALLVYPDRIEENIRRMIALARGAERLTPHIKTHKMPAVMAMQLRHGITRFKCATIAEAEMAAGCGAKDLLLAMQPVGPAIGRWVRLLQAFPATRFLTIVDDAEVCRALSVAATAARMVFDVLLDLDGGMHRCGIAPGPGAAALYQHIASLPGLRPAGLHAYDGHLHQVDATERAAACETAFAPVAKLAAELRAAGLPLERIVAGGTPTFPMHARRPAVECSPGTCVLWDIGYSRGLPDMDFQIAAVVLTRVVSRPTGNRVCLDLGHKAIAAENPQPRAEFPQLPEAKPMMHSEEHLVLETAEAGRWRPGDVVYALPKHICPTVALLLRQCDLVLTAHAIANH